MISQYPEQSKGDWQEYRRPTPHKLGRLTVEAASIKYKTSPTAPSVLRTVGLIATHTGELPLLRSDLEERTGMKQAAQAQVILLLARIGAINEGEVKNSANVVRHTVVQTRRFNDFIDEYPEWAQAIETQDAENRLLEVAAETGLSRNAALHMLVDKYLESPEVG